MTRYTNKLYSVDFGHTGTEKHRIETPEPRKYAMARQEEKPTLRYGYNYNLREYPLTTPTSSSPRYKDKYINQKIYQEDVIPKVSNTVLRYELSMFLNAVSDLKLLLSKNEIYARDHITYYKCNKLEETANSLVKALKERETPSYTNDYKYGLTNNLEIMLKEKKACIKYLEKEVIDFGLRNKELKEKLIYANEDKLQLYKDLKNGEKKYKEQEMLLRKVCNELNELRNTHTKNHSLQQEISTLKQKIKDLQFQNTSFKPLLNNLKNNKDMVLKDFNNKYKQLLTVYDKKVKEYSTKLMRIKESLSKLVDKKSEDKLLNSQKDKIEQLSGVVNNYRNKVRKLEAVIANNEKEKEELKSESEAAKNKLKLMEDVVKEFNFNLEEFYSTIIKKCKQESEEISNRIDTVKEGIMSMLSCKRGGKVKSIKVFKDLLNDINELKDTLPSIKETISQTSDLPVKCIEMIQDHIAQKDTSLAKSILFQEDNIPLKEKNEELENFIVQLQENAIVQSKQMNQLREEIEDHKEQMKEKDNLITSYNNAEEIIKVLITNNEVQASETKDIIVSQKSVIEQLIQKKAEGIEAQLSNFMEKIQLIVEMIESIKRKNVKPML